MRLWQRSAAGYFRLSARNMVTGNSLSCGWLTLGPWMSRDPRFHHHGSFPRAPMYVDEAAVAAAELLAAA